MRSLKALLVAALLCLAVPAMAQGDAGGSRPADEDVRELLAAMNVVKLGDQMLDQIFTSYERLIRDVPAEVWQKMRQRMHTSDLVELVIPIYQKHFSREDIRGLIAFYRSPLGRKFISRQGELSRESMAVGMAWGQKIGKEVAEELRTRGYKVPREL